MTLKKRKTIKLLKHLKSEPYFVCKSVYEDKSEFLHKNFPNKYL